VQRINSLRASISILERRGVEVSINALQQASLA